MRIVVLAIGTRGDVDPYIAIGKGLQHAGHEVVIASHPVFEDLVRSADLDYSALAGDPRQAADDMIEKSGRDAAIRITSFTRQIVRVAKQRMVQTMRDGLFACRDADLIVASQLGIGVGYHITERLQLPLVRAFYAPVTPTGYYPAFRLPDIIGRSQNVNLWTHQLAHQLAWLAFRGTMNRSRRQVLGLGRTSLGEPFQEMDRQGSLLIYGYSPTVAPRPSDWPEGIKITGYWFRSNTPDWSPPDDLVEFLAAGPPPIYIGFGSMMFPVIREIADRLTQAALDAGQRVIVSVGWAGASAMGGQSAVKVVGDVPHDWLFPRMAAVIHHGGAGTTAQGLRAGVPTQIVPFLPDQIFWGRRVQDLGAGGPPLLPSDVDQADLPSLIDNLVNSRDMRQRAEALGHHIRSEDGVGHAVALIQDYYGEWQRSRLPL